jgi:hypothetical protein
VLPECEAVEGENRYIKGMIRKGCSLLLLGEDWRSDREKGSLQKVVGLDSSYMSSAIVCSAGVFPPKKKKR